MPVGSGVLRGAIASLAAWGCLLSATAGARGAPEGGKWALVVGVSAYRHASIPSLRYADDDAAAIGKALVEHAGFVSDRVTVMTSSSRGVLQPTVENVVRAVEEIARRARPGDRIVLFFSCHGFMVDGVTPCLACVDTDATPGKLVGSSLFVAHLMDVLRASSASELLLILDACRDVPGGGRGGSALSPLRPASVAKAISAVARDRKTCAILLACADGERAYEDAESGHGAYTKALLEVLREPHGVALSPQTADALTRKITAGLPRSTASLQHPWFSVLGVSAEGRSGRVFSTVQRGDAWLVVQRRDNASAELPMLEIRASAGGMTAQQRAVEIAGRFTKVAASGQWDAWSGTLQGDFWDNGEYVVVHSKPERGYIVTVTYRDVVAHNKDTCSATAKEMVELMQRSEPIRIVFGSAGRGGAAEPPAASHLRLQGDALAARGDWASAEGLYRAAVEAEGARTYIDARLALIECWIELGKASAARAGLNDIRWARALTADQRQRRASLAARLVQIGQ